MGTDDQVGFASDGEGPVRRVHVAPFHIDIHAVTNADFAEFVTQTQYVSEAEHFGWSDVFAAFLPSALRRGAPRPERSPWWCDVAGAHWKTWEGPGSDTAGREDHPAVHVSWNDALAYWAWAHTRLPTEAEWEYAARGGVEQRRYPPGGDELTPDEVHRCNIWQGHFPTKNTHADGHAGTSPVDTFSPNAFGLHDMAGNVWEGRSDWWTTNHDTTHLHNPTGPTNGHAKAARGGSYLCHDSYCNCYRVASRTNNTPPTDPAATPDSAASHPPHSAGEA